MSGPNGIGLPDRPLVPPGLLNQILGRHGPEAARTFLTFIDQGLSPGQAFNSTVNAADPAAVTYPGGQGQPTPTPTPSAVTDPASPPSTSTVVDPQTVGQVYEDLPQDLQQLVLRDAGALSPPIRDALNQLGVTQPQLPGNDDAVVPGQLPARDAPGRADSPASSSAQALGSPSQSAPPPAQVASAFAAREAAPQQAVAFANPQAVPTQQGERAMADLAQPLQVAGRAAEGQVAARAPDQSNVIVMADRANLAQQQQAQTLPAFAQGRPDAVPAQAAMATLAGATMLANPQGNPALAQVQTTAPAGTTHGLDGPAMQARDAQLAPAGHTLAGFLRRDRFNKHGAPAHDGQGESLLAALLPGRRRRAEGEEQSTSFQWVFWILTIAAYASVAVAIVAMLPSGGSLSNGAGRPSAAGYALIVGAVAAVAAWYIGRRLSRDTR